MLLNGLKVRSSDVTSVMQSEVTSGIKLIEAQIGTLSLTSGIRIVEAQIGALSLASEIVTQLP